MYKLHLKLYKRMRMKEKKLMPLDPTLLPKKMAYIFLIKKLLRVRITFSFHVSCSRFTVSDFPFLRF